MTAHRPTYTKLIRFFIICILAQTFVNIRAQNFSQLRKEASHVYYNPTTGYILLNPDTLYIFVPEMSDSSQYYCAAKCEYHFYDSIHIVFKSSNTDKAYLDQKLVVSTRDTIPGQEHRININIEDGACEFELHLTSYTDSKLYKWAVATTDLHKASVMIDPSVRYIKLSAIPINYNYIPSNPNYVYYGLMMFEFPYRIEIGEATNVDITIKELTQADMRLYYIPESYIKIAPDKKVVNWRGYYYFDIGIKDP